MQVSEVFTALQTGALDATEFVSPFNDLAAGYHTVAVQVSRGASNTREIYHFFDDITITSLSVAIPEPSSALLLVGASGCLVARRRG